MEMDGLAFVSGPCISIATGEMNDGHYDWTVPNTPTNAGRIKLTAHDLFTLQNTDMTDGYFNILNTTNAPVLSRTGIQLSPAAPNPIREQTRVSFTLPVGQEVRLSVYDARGRRVRDLLSGYQTAGENSVVWDGKDRRGVSVPSGFYVVRLEAGGEVFTRSASVTR